MELDRGSRRARRPGRGAFWSSVGLHVALVAGAWLALGSRPRPIEMVVYRVDLVSPPPQVAGETRPAVQETPAVVTPQDAPEPEPEPEPAEPEPNEPETPPERAPEPSRDAAPPQAQPTEQPPEPEPEEAPPVAGRRPDPASPGGEDLNVRLEGEEFPFPAYLQNVVLQLNRHFRWTGEERPSAEVFFFIMKDGSVSDLRITRRSGNVRFDFEALAAVEQAGRRGAFGPLPDGFQGDRLPVSFFFRPAG